jgi:hypothetical protein
MTDARTSTTGRDREAIGCNEELIRGNADPVRAGQYAVVFK